MEQNTSQPLKRIKIFLASSSELEADRTLPHTGNLFIGTKGKILQAGDYGDFPRLLPESRMKEQAGRIKNVLIPKIVRSPGHMKEFVMAAKGEKPVTFAKSNFRYAGPMTEVIQLGNVALRLNRKITLDAKARKIANIASANQYLDRDYRDGWDIR